MSVPFVHTPSAQATWHVRDGDGVTVRLTLGVRLNVGDRDGDVDHEGVSDVDGVTEGVRDRVVDTGGVGDAVWVRDWDGVPVKVTV